MRDYEVCLPENEDWCVPALLQTVLKSRGIRISQVEISKKFPRSFERSIFRGFEFNHELLEEFLKEQVLTCSFHNPFIDPRLYQSSDLFLSKVEGDVIVAYDSKFQQKTERRQVPHVSIFLKYSFQSDLVKLVDSDILLPLLVKNMHPNMNRDYGFYVIE